MYAQCDENGISLGLYFSTLKEIVTIRKKKETLRKNEPIVSYRTKFDEIADSFEALYLKSKKIKRYSLLKRIISIESIAIITIIALIFALLK